MNKVLWSQTSNQTRKPGNGLFLDYKTTNRALPNESQPRAESVNSI